jgi:hypothetical protein
MNGQYEVLNPWAEVDPIPLKGIAPRVADLTGKTVGLFAITYKRASQPILNVVEEKLKERFSALKFSWFLHPFNLVVADMDHAGGMTVTPEVKAQFEEWVKGVDVVAAAVGD